VTALAARTGLRQIRADYRRWHWLQVRTRDIDPVYPVLRRLAADLDLSPDRAAWLCLLHVAYYHLGSALAAFSVVPDPAAPTEPLLHLPCATERRGNRDAERLRRHWTSLLRTVEGAGGPDAWLTGGLSADRPEQRWRLLNDRATGVFGNGRWAAYKTAELAQKVLCAPVVVADAGHANSTGPRHGLNLLHPALPAGNAPDTIARLDRYTAALAADLGDSDLGQVETSLCDFHSLASGGYYLGHDVDAMQAQLAAVPSDLTAQAVAARLGTIPAAYLGEVGGWTGVDRERRRAYRDTGRILERP
jgi:rhodanese-related sulfurtransferase